MNINLLELLTSLRLLIVFFFVKTAKSNDNDHLKKSSTQLTEEKFRFWLAEDPMATDKLYEGIQLFAKDSKVLNEFIMSRLQHS